MTKKNEAGTMNHEAFTGIFGALRAVYQAEVERLADVLRLRILAGEFSGTENDGRGDPAHNRLQEELEKTHPWAQGEELGRAVLAVSPWAYSDKCTMVGLGVEFDDVGLRSEVSECLAHDVLELAVSRGWVRGYKRLGPSYMLKVA